MPRIPNPQLIALWRQRIDCQRASGLTVLKFCKKNEILPHNFYYWLRKLRALDTPASPVGLIPVRVVDVPAEPSATIRFRSGVTIEGDPHILRLAIDQILASEQAMKGAVL